MERDPKIEAAFTEQEAKDELARVALSWVDGVVSEGTLRHAIRNVRTYKGVR